MSVAGPRPLPPGSRGPPSPASLPPLATLAPRHGGRGFGRAVSRFAGRFCRLPPWGFLSGLSLRSAYCSGRFRHWRSGAFYTCLPCFRWGPVALWRYCPPASAPQPGKRPQGRRQVGIASAFPFRSRASPKPSLCSGFGDALPLLGNAFRSTRAQKLALLRADRWGWGLFLRGASAACSVFSASSPLPLRRCAFAYTCARRFRPWDGSRWSPSHGLPLQRALSPTCFQPLRLPFCLRAVPPYLPPCRQCLSLPSRPLRPRS